MKKTERNILIAFVLNLAFSIFEFVGGTLTNSVAIMSDAIHDLGDALSVGFAWAMERKSKKNPNTEYTYGYTRYSVIGSLFTTLVLLVGSCIVIYGAVKRLINPIEINYDKMVIFAVIGVLVNFCAAWATKDGDSLNQKAVNLHMIEDIAGWVVVLIGAIIMNFTDIQILDPLLSIVIALFILINALRNLKEIIQVLAEKSPVSVENIVEHIKTVEGVIDVHHVHIWSLDGNNNYATMHIVTNENEHEIKEKIREMLNDSNVVHSTLELETSNEYCHEKECHVEIEHNVCHTHHRHHEHH